MPDFRHTPRYDPSEKNTPAAKGRADAAQAQLASTITTRIDDQVALDHAVDTELKALLEKVPADRRAKVKEACVALRLLKQQENVIKAESEKAKASWLVEMEVLSSQFKIDTMPFLDPVTSRVQFSYRREDDVLLVVPADLREAMIEYYTKVHGIDEELAVIQVTDLMVEVLAEPKIVNDKYKAMKTAGRIPDEVAIAVERWSKKAPWVAFEKTKTA